LWTQWQIRTVCGRVKKRCGNISGFLRSVSAQVGGMHRYLVSGWWVPEQLGRAAFSELVVEGFGVE